MGKLKLVVLSIVIMGLALAGCGKSNTSGEPSANSSAAAPELVTVAEQNKQIIDKLGPIKEKVDKVYKDFEGGKINQQQLAQSLDQPLTELEQIKTDYLNYFEEHPVSEEVKENPTYKDGLSNATKALTDALSFVRTAARGNIETSNGATKYVPLSKQELKDKYKSKMLEDYPEHVDNFNQAYTDIQK